MTKTLLTKIVIGVLATGTVGTVGLVVASKVPVTAPVVKSIPVVGQYIDVVTFNKGLNDEEFNKLMNFEELVRGEFLKQHIKETYNLEITLTDPSKYSIMEILESTGVDDMTAASMTDEVVNYMNNELNEKCQAVGTDLLSRASSKQIQEYKESRKVTYVEQEPEIHYMDENGQVVTIKGQDNIDEYYRTHGGSSMDQMEQEMLKQQQQEREQQTQRNKSNQ